MQKKRPHKESHANVAPFIREFVFGTNDGLVTTLALVMGFFGAVVSSRIIIVGAFAEMVAAAISMALGSYISTKSQIEVYEKEIEREKYEIDNFPEIEKKEVETIYKKKGFKGGLLKKVVKTITSKKKVWLNIMMEEELGLTEVKESPAKNALVMGFSDILGSLIPVIPLFFFHVNMAIIFSVVFSLIFLFVLGALRTFVSGKNWFKSGFEMLLIGSIAATAAFFMGKLISTLI